MSSRTAKRSNLVFLLQTTFPRHVRVMFGARSSGRYLSTETSYQHNRTMTAYPKAVLEVARPGHLDYCFFAVSGDVLG
jgi:hypothetical protein